MHLYNQAGERKMEEVIPNASRINSQRDIEICQKVQADINEVEVNQSFRRTDLAGIYSLSSTRISQIVTDSLGSEIFRRWNKIPKTSLIVRKFRNDPRNIEFKNEIEQTLYDYYERKTIAFRPTLREMADRYNVSPTTARNMINKLLGRETRIRWKKIPEFNKRISENNRRPREIAQRARQMIEDFKQNQDFVRPTLEDFSSKYGDISRERVRQILNERLSPEEYEFWKSIPRLNDYFISKSREITIINMIQSEVDSYFNGQADRLSTDTEMAKRFHLSVQYMMKLGQIEVLVKGKKHQRARLLRMQNRGILHQLREILNLILDQMKRYDDSGEDDSELLNNSAICRLLGHSYNRMPDWTRRFLPEEVFLKRRTILSNRDMRARWLKYPNLEEKVMQYIQECIALYEEGKIAQVPTPYELMEKFECSGNKIYCIIRPASKGANGPTKMYTNAPPYEALKIEYKRLTFRYRKS